MQKTCRSIRKMNKIVSNLLSVMLFANAIYHFRIWLKCTYPAKLTTGMKVVLVVIPLVYLSLAYSVGHGLMENVVVVIAVSLSVISRVVGQGISEEGIYYWTRTGVNRLARWKTIKKVDMNDAKNRLEKICFEDYSWYLNQRYQKQEIQEIVKYIQRRI